MNLTIIGGERWTKPQTSDEAATMAGFVARVADTPGRCADCAFRSGTDANRSQLVLHLVEMCLTGDQEFRCHHGDDPTPVCAGWKALIDSYAPANAQRGNRCPNS